MADIISVSSKSNHIPDILITMSYGPALDSSSFAKTWLSNKKLGPFIDGKYKETSSLEYEVFEGCSATLITKVRESTEDDVNEAVCSSLKAADAWSKLSAHQRARHLYSLARHLQKHGTILAQMESLNRGVQSRDPKEFDVPTMVRYFYHYAGWAQLSSSSELTNWKPLGVVAGILSGTSPLAVLALIIAPALAAGNTICLKPSHHAPLPALLFASIASQAGLPPGVINILPGGEAVNKLLGTHPQVSKVTFSGPTSVGRVIQNETAGLGSSLTLFLNGGNCNMIVFDSADLDSAVQEAVNSAWFNQGQLPWSMRRLLIQESIFNKFISKLKDCMDRLHLGSAFNRQADLGSPLDKAVISNVREAAAEAERNGLEVFQKKLPKDLSAEEFFPPTLIIGGAPYNNQTVDEDILLPIIIAQPFRTAKEAVTIANNSRYGLAASVWTENATLAAEVAYKLQVGTVWINSHGTMDASVPLAAWKQSGIGVFGGKEGLLEYMQYKGVRPNMTTDEVDTASFGQATNSSSCFPDPKSSTDLGPKVDCTYKLYYGGAHKRPDNNLYRNVNDGTGKVYAAVPEGSRKDVRNAVEAAVKAQPSWWKLGAHGRSQILYNAAEKLQLQREDFISRLTILYGKTDEDAAAREVDECLTLLFHWAANCDKKVVVASETNVSGNALNISREPMGVIGIVQAPVPSPTGPLALLSFIQLFAPAVCYGNTVVVLADNLHPTPAIEFCQVLDTSDFPAGVVNVLTGSQEQMLTTLANHQEVNALWALGTIAKTAKYIEISARHNFKRTWVDKLPCFENLEQSTDCRELFEMHSTRVKSVWMPYGEIFAN